MSVSTQAGAEGRRQRDADRAVRAAMCSPGRPPMPRASERAFWRLIASEADTEDAAVAVGVSAPVGARLFRHGGGMPSLSLVEPVGSVPVVG